MCPSQSKKELTADLVDFLLLYLISNIEDIVFGNKLKFSYSFSVGGIGCEAAERNIKFLNNFDLLMKSFHPSFKVPKALPEKNNLNF
jgi:hypothetical protein